MSDRVAHSLARGLGSGCLVGRCRITWLEGVLWRKLKSSMAEIGGVIRESFLRCLYSPGWSQTLALPDIAFSRARIIGIRMSVYMGRVAILGMEIVFGKDLGEWYVSYFAQMGQFG